VNRILSEIHSRLHLIRNFHTALFKSFEQASNDMGMRAFPVFCHQQCFERFLYSLLAVTGLAGCRQTFSSLRTYVHS
jgi:hypothetical protein